MCRSSFSRTFTWQLQMIKLLYKNDNDNNCVQKCGIQILEVVKIKLILTVKVTATLNKITT